MKGYEDDYLEAVEVKPSDFANDPNISRFAADLMRLKAERMGGRKEREIELGEVCGWGMVEIWG